MPRSASKSRRCTSFAASGEEDQRKYLIEEVQRYLDQHEYSEVQEERWRTSFSRRLGGLDSAVNANAASIGEKVDTLERHNGAATASIVAVDAKVDALQAQVGALEAKIETKIDQLLRAVQAEHLRQAYHQAPKEGRALSQQTVREDPVRPTEGSRVMIVGGDDRVGSVGQIIEDDQSDVPFNVRFDDGAMQWFSASDVQAAVPPGPGRSDDALRATSFQRPSTSSPMASPRVRHPSFSVKPAL